MVEYLQGAIRASADYDNNFSVTISDGTEPVVGDLVLSIGDLNIQGNYDAQNECYEFTIPANTVSGKQDYQFVLDGETLVFPQKIYFV